MATNLRDSALVSRADLERLVYIKDPKYKSGQTWKRVCLAMTNAGHFCPYKTTSPNYTCQTQSHDESVRIIDGVFQVKKTIIKSLCERWLQEHPKSAGPNGVPYQVTRYLDPPSVRRAHVRGLTQESGPSNRVAATRIARPVQEVSDQDSPSQKSSA